MGKTRVPDLSPEEAVLAWEKMKRDEADIEQRADALRLYFKRHFARRVDKTEVIAGRPVSVSTYLRKTISVERAEKKLRDMPKLLRSLITKTDVVRVTVGKKLLPSKG